MFQDFMKTPSLNRQDSIFSLLSLIKEFIFFELSRILQIGFPVVLKGTIALLNESFSLITVKFLTYKE